MTVYYQIILSMIMEWYEFSQIPDLTSVAKQPDTTVANGNRIHVVLSDSELNDESSTDDLANLQEVVSFL